MQEKGKEIPDFNTVYYDRATKRIIKRTERKVKAEGLLGKMIIDMAVMLGTDQDPRFTLRSGSAFIQASEDNVSKIMIDLEQSKKYSARLKDTLKHEREERNRLKRKYEDVQREMKSSRAEVQALQVEMQVKETAQEALEKVQKECQDIKGEKG